MTRTPVSLLERLKQPEPDRAWERFVDLYTPLLLYWARRAGMQPQDAADLVQDVFVTLLGKLPEFNYDPNRSFRAWLRTVIMNKWRDRQRVKCLPSVNGTEALSAVASPEEAEALWDTEVQQQLVRRALHVMQTEFEPATWKACWAMVVEGKPAAAIGRELNLSENAVYIAKSRVLRRLRRELEGMV